MSEEQATAGRRYRGISKEDRQGERRQRLVQAGLEVFGTRGYHASTVRSICQAAGVTERYFYESFANSEELLCATYEHVRDSIMREVLAAAHAAPRDPEEITRAMLAAFFDYLRANPTALRVCFIEILGVSPRVDELYRSGAKAFATMMVAIGRAVSSPPSSDGSKYDEEWVATGLVGAVSVMIHRWWMEDFKTPRDVVVRSAQAMFIAVGRDWLARPTIHS